jgi:hypothetical protein
MAMTFAGQQWNRLDPALVQYVEANQGSAAYVVATPSSSYASLFILDTGQPALALGGYQGWDRILTPDALAGLVRAGLVRFFYLPATSARPGPDASLDATADLVSWVTASCASVPPSAWSSSATTPATSNLQLYDCG